jgi:hypothetical protein
VHHRRCGSSLYSSPVVAASLRQHKIFDSFLGGHLGDWKQFGEYSVSNTYYPELVFHIIQKTYNAQRHLQTHGYLHYDLWLKRTLDRLHYEGIRANNDFTGSEFSNDFIELAQILMGILSHYLQRKNKSAFLATDLSNAEKDYGMFATNKGMAHNLEAFWAI